MDNQAQDSLPEIVLPPCANIPEVPDLHEYGKRLIKRWDEKDITNIVFMVETPTLYSIIRLTSLGPSIKTIDF
jgi:hypothetical protein